MHDFLGWDSGDSGFAQRKSLWRVRCWPWLTVSLRQHAGGPRCFGGDFKSFCSIFKKMMIMMMMMMMVVMMMMMTFPVDIHISINEMNCFQCSVMCQDGNARMGCFSTYIMIADHFLCGFQFFVILTHTKVLWFAEYPSFCFVRQFIISNTNVLLSPDSIPILKALKIPIFDQNPHDIC